MNIRYLAFLLATVHAGGEEDGISGKALGSVFRLVLLHGVVRMTGALSGPKDLPIASLVNISKFSVHPSTEALNCHS
jgi:hypothetical protein